MLHFPAFAALWRYLVAVAAVASLGLGAVPLLIPETGATADAGARAATADGTVQPSNWDTNTWGGADSDTEDDAEDGTTDSTADEEHDEAGALSNTDPVTGSGAHDRAGHDNRRRPTTGDARDEQKTRKDDVHARKRTQRDTTPTRTTQPVTAASPQAPSQTPDRNSAPPTHSTPEPTTPARRKFPVTIGSWNVLGASHTEGRGCKRCHLPDSFERMPATVRAIGRHNLDILGLQEFQPNQQAMFRRQMPGWEIYANADNAVAWNTRTFAFVTASTFTIPYFGGNPRQMPLVRLKHRASGREIAVMSVHNPADVRGPARRWREEAVRTEASIANTLTAADVPVFLTGDMNDRAEFFCQITAASTLVASAGGTRGTATCAPPARMDVDWILGSGPHVTFTRHLSDNSADVDFASDHPLIVATATVS